MNLLVEKLIVLDPTSREACITESLPRVGFKIVY